MSVHKKPDGTWYVHWRDEYKNRHTQVFGKGKANEKLAHSFDLQIKADKKRLKSTVPEAKSTTTLDELAQAYVNHCRANGKDGPWLRDLISLLNNHWLPKLTHKPVNELTYQDMLKFIEDYAEHSQTTRNRYFDYLKVIFNFGIRHEMTKVNPLAQWQKKKEAPRQTLLTVEDLIKIHSNAEPHLQWCIDVVWYTGIRPGPKELFALRWENVDFDRGIVRVLGKRNIWREVPISDGFRQQLLEMKAIAKTDHLVEYHGRPLQQLRRSLKTACTRAEIPYPVCMYDIRHLFASILLAKGADLAAVSKILGHTSTKMTADQYYHLLYGEKKRAVDLVPELRKDENGKVIRLSSKKE